MASIRILKPGDEALVTTFCARHPDTTLFFMNNMLSAGLEDRGERFQGTYVAAMEDGAVVALAAHFWNSGIILEAPTLLPEVVRAAAEASAREVAMFLGPYGQTLEASAALGLAGATMRMDSREILYALNLADLCVPEALSSGMHKARRALPSDLLRLLPWRIAYTLEALGEVDSPELRATIEKGLRSPSRRAWVLESTEEVVSTTGFNATTPDVVQVGGVWTPPELRSRGYARSAVAGSLLDARAGGAKRSILFTPEDNFAAQACYRGLGYREIGDYGLLMLAERHRPFG